MWVGQGALQSTDLTLLSADFVAPPADAARHDVDQHNGPAAGCRRLWRPHQRAGALRDGDSTFQIRISVSPLPVSRRRQLAAVEEANTTQVGAIEVGAVQHGLEQVGPGRARARERRLAEHRSTKIGGSGEVGAAQIETSQAGTGQVRRHLRVLGAPAVPFPNAPAKQRGVLFIRHRAL